MPCGDGDGKVGGEILILKVSSYVPITVELSRIYIYILLFTRTDVVRGL